MTALFYLAAGLVWAVAQAVGVGSSQQDDGPVGCVDVPAPTLNVHFRRTPGVGDFQGFPDVDLDASRLSDEDAAHLRKMVEDARFFELSSSPALPPDIPDPIAGYELKVEMDGRTHDIWVTDGDVGKSLQPLIDWLTVRAKLERSGRC